MPARHSEPPRGISFALLIPSAVPVIPITIKSGEGPLSSPLPLRERAHGAGYSPGPYEINVVRCADGPAENPKKVLARRLESWKPPAPRYTTGVLAKYIKLVGPAATGVVIG